MDFLPGVTLTRVEQGVYPALLRINGGRSSVAGPYTIIGRKRCFCWDLSHQPVWRIQTERERCWSDMERNFNGMDLGVRYIGYVGASLIGYFPYLKHLDTFAVSFNVQHLRCVSLYEFTRVCGSGSRIVWGVEHVDFYICGNVMSVDPCLMPVVGSELQCTVCYAACSVVVKICEHPVCRACLGRWSDECARSSAAFSCPYCRRDLTSLSMGAIV